MTFAVEGSWWRDVGWETWLGKSYMLSVLSSGMWKVRCYSRGSMEDEYLRREFKDGRSGQRACQVKYCDPPGIC